MRGCWFNSLLKVASLLQSDQLIGYAWFSIHYAQIIAHVWHYPMQHNLWLSVTEFVYCGTMCHQANVVNLIPIKTVVSFALL